ncbi:MAG TPA: hypothetical protein VJV05_17700 [Pyrinomonadaceae bacterium]|nr:hypothetical protein [Pyrinomonadaceae bacterium]
MAEVPYVRGAIEAGDCIGRAWELVSRQFWLYVGLGLVTILMIGCIPCLSNILFGPILGGFYYFVLRDNADEPVDFGMLFKGFEKFLPLMLVGLIQSIPGIVWTIFQYSVDIARVVGEGSGGDVGFYQSAGDGFAAGLSVIFILLIVGFVLFSIAWTMLLTFAIPLVMEHDLGVVDALTTSARATGSNLAGLVLLIIFEALVAILGMLVLCVGIFVAMPVIYAANVIAYRYVFPHGPRRDYNTAPPPPTAYGPGAFGNNY